MPKRTQTTINYHALLIGLLLHAIILPINATAQTAEFPENILGGAAVDESSWIQSPWFGWYWVSDDNPAWIYSLDWESYLYVAEGEENGVFLWEYPERTWYLTQPEAYSWVWSLESNQWIDALLLGATRDWVFHKRVAQGTQFDVAAGPGQLLHLVSIRYNQIDRYGNKIVTELNGDSGQSRMNFPPAIAVGSTGEVHTVTRSDSGFTDLELRYRKRTIDGTWSTNYQYGTVSKRNYVVGIAVPDSAQPVLCHTTAYDNVWGDVFLYEAGPDAATPVGAVRDIWRADNDARLKSHGNKVFLVAGLNDPNGKATISWGMAGPSMVQQLNANKKTHKAGDGGENRRGFPDLALDGSGTAHLVYGAYQTLQYNRYDSQGQLSFPEDRELFNELGEYHLSAGLGAIGVSEDGSTVLAVALKTDDSKIADVCQILWTLSRDGGMTWSEPEDLGVRTSGGEGRLRPRIVTIGSTFYLFFHDIDAGGISLAIRHFQEE